MVLYQINLRSKELDGYKSFLSRLKSLGDNFLIKGNIWTPSIKTESNTPGIHVAKDPMLEKYYQETENPMYLKYTCSHLSDTLKEINQVRGRKNVIQVIISEEELILQINDTQWVIASKYKEDTVDFIPQFEYFKNILSISSEWHELSIEILQNLIDGHPVSLVAKIANSDELSVIRLTRKLMKLRSDQCKTLDHKGQYTLISAAGDNFDETVCQIILHMEYKNIECINMYFVRKYTK